MDDIVNVQLKVDDFVEKNPVLSKNSTSVVFGLKFPVTTFSIFQTVITKRITKTDQTIHIKSGVLRRAFPNVVVNVLKSYDGLRLSDYFDFCAAHCFMLSRTSSVENPPDEFSILSINCSISSSDAGLDGFVQLYSVSGSWTAKTSASVSSDLTNLTDLMKSRFETAFKKACRLFALPISTKIVFIRQKYKKVQRKRGKFLNLLSKYICFLVER